MSQLMYNSIEIQNRDFVFAVKWPTLPSLYTREAITSARAPASTTALASTTGPASTTAKASHEFSSLFVHYKIAETDLCSWVTTLMDAADNLTGHLLGPFCIGRLFAATASRTGRL